MITYCKENLDDLKSMLSVLDQDQYIHSSSLLSNSSIGQHIRHILEFYTCLINGYKSGVVNYDKRARNLTIENNISFALASIDEIQYHLNLIVDDIDLVLEANFGSKEDFVKINSSVYRELAYCLEHSIHHQALIKIGLIDLQCHELVNNNFGVAPATIRHKEQVAE